MKRKAISLMAIALATATVLTGCSPKHVYELGYTIGTAIREIQEYDGYVNNNGNNNSNNQNNNNSNNNNNNNNEPTEFTQTTPGVLDVGPNEISDELHYYVTHDYTDITYDRAVSYTYYGDSQNYMLLGGYAYHTISDDCSDSADYTSFSNKSMQYSIYEQYINGSDSSYYESVLPVYIESFVGCSDGFADSISCFTGSSYIYDDDNPFYEPTQEKQQRIYDELVGKYGSFLGEQYFRNYQQILNTYFIKYTSLIADGTTGEMKSTSTYGGMYFVEVDDNGEGNLFIADVMIDTETFEMSIQDVSGWLKYSIKFADDRSSYTLYDEEMSLTYEKTSDYYLCGYVNNADDAFYDIVGIELAMADYYHPKCYMAMYDAYDYLGEILVNPKIILADGTVAVDPDLSIGNGMLTISFSTVYDSETDEEIPYQFSCTVEYGLIGHLHEKNNGFVLSDENGSYYFTFSSYGDFDSYVNHPGNDEDDPDGDDDSGVDAYFDGSGAIELIGSN